MSEEYKRRGYDKTSWPVNSDGNGNFLLGRKSTFFSFGLVIVIVTGAVYATQTATWLRGAIDYNTEQTAIVISQISNVKDQRRNYEKAMSDALGEIKSDIRILQYRVQRIESSSRVSLDGDSLDAAIK